MQPKAPGFFSSIARDIRNGMRNFKENTFDACHDRPTHDEIEESSILDRNLQLQASHQDKVHATRCQTAPVFGPTDDIDVAMIGNGIIIASLNPHAKEPVYELANCIQVYMNSIGGEDSGRGHSSIYIAIDHGVSVSGKRLPTLTERWRTGRNMETILDHAFSKSKIAQARLPNYCLNINDGNFSVKPEIIEACCKVKYLGMHDANIMTQFIKSTPKDNACTEDYADLAQAIFWGESHDESMANSWRVLLSDYLVNATLDSDMSIATKRQKACILGYLLRKRPAVLTLQTKERLVGAIQEAIASGISTEFNRAAEAYVADYKKYPPKTIDLTIRYIKRLKAPMWGLQHLKQHVNEYKGSAPRRQSSLTQEEIIKP